MGFRWEGWGESQASPGLLQGAVLWRLQLCELSTPGLEILSRVEGNTAGCEES